MKNKNGFTLIELLVVIAIIAIVAAMIVPLIKAVGPLLWDFIKLGSIYFTPPLAALLCLFKINQKKKLLVRTNYVIKLKGTDYVDTTEEFKIKVALFIFFWPIAIFCAVVFFSVRWLLNKIKGGSDFIPKE